MELDFNNLSAKHQKLLNLISVDVQKDIIILIDSLFNQSAKNTFILMHPLFSRNPYRSDLFVSLCFLRLVDNLMKSSKGIKKILCNTKFEKKILENKYGKLFKVVSHKNKNSNLKPFLDFIKILIRCLYFNFTKNKKRKILNTENHYTLIDTFLTKNCIKNNRIVDRYYTDILEYADQKELNNIFFFPSISNFPSNKTITKIAKNSNENLIFKHDYLKFKNYSKVFFRLFHTLKIKYNSINFYDYDITKLVNNELKINRYNPSFFEGLLNYEFVKNLKANNIKIKCLIDWNENQSIDKGLILGMKTFYPRVITKGYQGYIISTDFNHYIKPSNLEIANNLIPDYIYVIGKKLRNRIKTNSKNLKVKVAPAYRLKSIFDDSINFKKANSILVILPIGINESINIISMVLDSGLLNYRSVFLKPHPLLKFKNILNHFGSSRLSKFIYTNDDVNILIQKHSVTIGSASTALIESLIRCTPVLLIANKNLIQNPIPLGINPNIWKICYDYKDIINNLFLLEEYLINNFDKIKRDSNLIKNNYFEKPSKKLTREFLN